MSGQSFDLVIAHAWDGTPLPEAEHVFVHLFLTTSDADEYLQQQLTIALDAPFYNDPPPPAQGSDPRSYGGLWNYEVVELFLGSAADVADPKTLPYLELEFGPHGHALGLVFGAYRQGARPITVPGEARRAHGRWHAEAIVAAEHLPPLPWVLNAFAIHGPAAARRYQVAFLPRDASAPDFHDRGSWRPCPLVPLALEVGATQRGK